MKITNYTAAQAVAISLAGVLFFAGCSESDTQTGEYNPIERTEKITQQAERNGKMVTVNGESVVGQYDENDVDGPLAEPPTQDPSETVSRSGVSADSTYSATDPNAMSTDVDLADNDLPPAEEPGMAEIYNQEPGESPFEEPEEIEEWDAPQTEQTVQSRQSTQPNQNAQSNQTSQSDVEAADYATVANFDYSDKDVDKMSYSELSQKMDHIEKTLNKSRELADESEEMRGQEILTDRADSLAQDVATLDMSSEDNVSLDMTQKALEVEAEAEEFHNDLQVK